MPLRTKNTYTTSKGTYNTRTRTFTGKGPAPSGMKKVRTPSAASVPTVTTSPAGEVTTSGFRTRQAAARASRRDRTARRRVHRITQATENRSVQRHRQASRRSEASVRSAEKTAMKAGQSSRLATTKTVISSRPSPTTAPETFEGRKTAGTPTRSELLRAKRTGTLEVNRKGFATTPAVRKTTQMVKRLESKARRSSGPLPTLTPAQSARAHTVLRRGERVGATRKEKLAAIETGLVEAPNFENPAGGDLDSEGWRQERTSIYGTGPQGPRNVKASADRFFDEVRSDPGTQSAPTPGLLAQAAQGSAFPERYDERAPEAKAILRAHNKGKLKPTQQRKLKKARRKAADLGLTALTKGKQAVPKKTMTRFKAAMAAAKELEGAKLPYVWGGGHGDPSSRPTGGGLDCSGAVSYVLNKMGALKGSLVSGSMGQALEPGPGAVTVFYNPVHTFMRIGKRYFGTSASNPAGGAGFIEGTPDDLSKYSVGHVPGLGRKVAVALGVPLDGGSFPGMELSGSGTTATIEPGAGMTKGKPGFSSSPIRLTPAQKARRTFRQLEQMGLGVGQEASGSKESSSATLSALERKYGVTA